MIRVPTKEGIFLPVDTHRQASKVLFDQSWIHDHAHLHKDRRDSAVSAVINPHIVDCRWTYADVQAIKSETRSRMANRRNNVSTQEKQGEKIGHAIKRYVVLYHHTIIFSSIIGFLS
jgi:hypothetical protein